MIWISVIRCGKLRQSDTDRKTRLLFAFLIALAQQPAAADQLASDRCWTTKEANAIKVSGYTGDRRCVDFFPEEEIAGIWVNDFEGSAFFEDAQSLADLRGIKGDVWFTIDDRTVLPSNFQRLQGHAYLIRMLGRKARQMNRKPLKGYGHMGMSRGLILANAIIVYEDLGPARAR